MEVVLARFALQQQEAQRQQAEIQKQMFAQLIATISRTADSDIPRTPSQKKRKGNIAQDPDGDDVNVTLSPEPSPAETTPAPRRSPRRKVKIEPMMTAQSRNRRKVGNKKVGKVGNKKGGKSGVQLKRTLSFNEAFRAGKRIQKPEDVRNLRKLLGAKIAVLDQKLFANRYHDREDRFIKDLFFEDVSPLISELIGVPGHDFTDFSLPARCMQLCKDIVKKKTIL